MTVAKMEQSLDMLDEMVCAILCYSCDSSDMAALVRCCRLACFLPWPDSPFAPYPDGRLPVSFVNPRRRNSHLGSGAFCRACGSTTTTPSWRACGKGSRSSTAGASPAVAAVHYFSSFWSLRLCPLVCAVKCCRCSVFPLFHSVRRGPCLIPVRSCAVSLRNEKLEIQQKNYDALCVPLPASSLPLWLVWTLRSCRSPLCLPAWRVLKQPHR